MPKAGETQRKIRQLKSGEGVKAPYAYWHGVLIPETKKEYPELPPERQAAIAGARWRNISKPEKIKIVKKWQSLRVVRRTLRRRAGRS